MGKIFKAKGLTTLSEVLILIVGLVVVCGAIYWLAPGLRVDSSKTLSGLTIDKGRLDNVTSGVMINLPSKNSADYTKAADGSKVPSKWNETFSTKVTNQPLLRIAEYAWNGNSGMLAANGGSRPIKGSLMEESNINLEIVRIDGVSDLRNMQLKFVDELASGKEFPTSDKSAFAVSIMGDGVPFYIATTQQALNDKFGKDKYHVQAIGAIGMSDGEDMIIGPAVWKTNPQLMRGCLLSSVIGDGDWVIAVNFAFANGIPVNPDIKTYDANAINFTPSENDDYINSVKELIKSKNTGFTIPLKEVKNGVLTGKTINKSIDGATTWTPGDKIAFDALSGFIDVVSTRDFTNQMATTMIVIKEWALMHENLIIPMLKNAYVASNQIKQYDDWAIFASKAVWKTYLEYETPEYWYDLFKGYENTKDGVTYNVGGSRVLNYADALQYYGISDGKNRYKTVYEQISTYLVELNPCGFNEAVTGGIIPYDQAVNLYFLKSINDIDVGVANKIDYTQTKTEVLATGEWHINFATNSSSITSFTELQRIYGLLVQAEKTKVKIYGYTDNVGDDGFNLILSKQRAESVKSWLINKGISINRFQDVNGYGESNPISDNNTASGQAQNRRCEITLLK